MPERRVAQNAKHYGHTVDEVIESKNGWEFCSDSNAGGIPIYRPPILC